MNNQRETRFHPNPKSYEGDEGLMIHLGNPSPFGGLDDPRDPSPLGGLALQGSLLPQEETHKGRYMS